MRKSINNGATFVRMTKHGVIHLYATAPNRCSLGGGEMGETHFFDNTLSSLYFNITQFYLSYLCLLFFSFMLVLFPTAPSLSVLVPLHCSFTIKRIRKALNFNPSRNSLSLKELRYVFFVDTIEHCQLYSTEDSSDPFFPPMIVFNICADLQRRGRGSHDFTAGRYILLHPRQTYSKL